jgi:hypothetical protein
MTLAILTLGLYLASVLAFATFAFVFVLWFKTKDKGRMLLAFVFKSNHQSLEF